MDDAENFDQLRLPLTNNKPMNPEETVLVKIQKWSYFGLDNSPASTALTRHENPSKPHSTSCYLSLSVLPTEWRRRTLWFQRRRARCL